VGCGVGCRRGSCKWSNRRIRSFCGKSWNPENSHIRISADRDEDAGFMELAGHAEEWVAKGGRIGRMARAAQRQNACLALHCKPFTNASKPPGQPNDAGVGQAFSLTFVFQNESPRSEPSAVPTQPDLRMGPTIHHNPLALSVHAAGNECRSHPPPVHRAPVGCRHRPGACRSPDQPLGFADWPVSCHWPSRRDCRQTPKRSP
jgi:hypothetical protein